MDIGKRHSIDHHEVKNLQKDQSLLAAEIRWMAAYSPHLDFRLAIKQAEADLGSLAVSKECEVGQ